MADPLATFITKLPEHLKWMEEEIGRVQRQISSIESYAVSDVATEVQNGMSLFSAADRIGDLEEELLEDEDYKKLTDRLADLQAENNRLKRYKPKEA